MMKDGLYSVQFATPLGAGSGVAHLFEGKIYGGDASLYYIGTFTVQGDEFSASVSTDVHSHYPGIASVFGKPKVTMQLKGTFVGDNANLSGSSPDAPGVSFSAKLVKLPA